MLTQLETSEECDRLSSWCRRELAGVPPRSRLILSIGGRSAVGFHAELSTLRSPVSRTRPRRVTELLPRELRLRKPSPFSRGRMARHCGRGFAYAGHKVSLVVPGARFTPRFDLSRRALRVPMCSVRSRSSSLLTRGCRNLMSVYPSLRRKAKRASSASISLKWCRRYSY